MGVHMELMRIGYMHMGGEGDLGYAYGRAVMQVGYMGVHNYG